MSGASPEGTLLKIVGPLFGAAFGSLLGWLPGGLAGAIGSPPTVLLTAIGGLVAAEPRARLTETPQLAQAQRR
jgi:hypothetical protein